MSVNTTDTRRTYKCCACCAEGVDPDLHADGRRDFHMNYCPTCQSGRSSGHLATRPVQTAGSTNLTVDDATREKGNAPPFSPYEGDLAALVHVLWDAKNAGLTIAENADEIAVMITRSRWLSARIDAVQGPVPVAVPGNAVGGSDE